MTAAETKHSRVPQHVLDAMWMAEETARLVKVIEEAGAEVMAISDAWADSDVYAQRVKALGVAEKIEKARARRRERAS